MPHVKKIVKHKIVLDTHVWIWLLSGEKHLSTEFKKSIQSIDDEERILISAISLWEIGMLVEKNRMKINMDVLDFVEQALQMSGTKLIPISPRIAIESSRLPGQVHLDPADRILIATAKEESAVLVSHDKNILSYGNNKYISVYDPT